MAYPNGDQTPKPNPNPIFNAYDQATGIGFKDYNSIMENYKNLFASAPGAQPLSYNKFTPETLQFQMPSSFGSALSKYDNMSKTGGYSSGDLQNIRGRSVSPIRAVYGNAQRNVERQRALQGGQGGNYNAVQAKMARELSSNLATASTDVEGNIAQMVAEGKRAGAAGYAPLAAQESSMMQQIAMMNANSKNSAEQFNANMGLETAKFNSQAESDYFRNKLAANSGMLSMYGTTPGMASTFGNQALQYNNQNLEAQRLKQQQEQAAFEAMIRAQQLRRN